MTMRLDVYLCERGFVHSRTEAKGLILAGAVTVNGKVVSKPAFDIPDEEADVFVDKSSKKYVSRGGLKLEAALDAFEVSVDGLLAIDVGASSGGFTDCLLQRGAAHVIAVDSGSGQLVKSILDDPRVTSIENYNARFMKAADFEYSPNFAVMDVSFISATYIIPALFECLASGAGFVCLVKPQFEVGRSNIGKGGIVKDLKIRKQALDCVVQFAKNVGFEFLGSISSPILGGDGNEEYLTYFKKK
jgi:23S rRNA (cytidine1920-2'-O)/16S rRNA (cytidine1409-2'-O)-methyltransferase